MNRTHIGDDDPSNRVNFCPNCGKQVEADWITCPYCARPIHRRPMVKVEQKALPDDAARRTEAFTGREWVLDAVFEWLEKGNERFFLLTGEPGSGKTSLSAWLAGVGPLPASANAASKLEQVREAWRAMHFCMAEDKRGSLNPSRFAQSLARQLSTPPPGEDSQDARNLYGEYAQAALNHIGSDIYIFQQAQENWGTIIGAQIENFIVNAKAEEVYNRVVREPLEWLFQVKPDYRVFILVDSLDEAMTYEDLTNIVTLLAGSDDLPDGVRFLLTSRNDDKIIDRFAIQKRKRLDLSSLKYARAVNADIGAYVSNRLAEPAIQRYLDTAGTAEQLQQQLIDRAAGNFLYIKFLLDEVANGKRTLDDLTSLPKGLYGLYRTYLDRLMPQLLQVGSSQGWLKEYQPPLGCLSVIMEPVSAELLAGWLGWPDESQVTVRLGMDLTQIVEYDLKGYRLYHRSVAEFLGTEAYQEEGNLVRNRYWTPSPQQHDRIIDFYLTQYQNNWDECDSYGLSNLVNHILIRLDQPLRTQQLQHLARELNAIVLNQQFRETQREVLGDLRPTLRDLRAVLDWSLKNDSFCDVLTCAGAYRDTIRSEDISKSVFDAVKAADLQLALRRAELYSATPDWAAVLMLYLAWEAALVGDANTAHQAVTQSQKEPLVETHQLCEAFLAHIARILAEKIPDSRNAADWLIEWLPNGDQKLILEQYRPAQVLSQERRDELMRELRDRLVKLLRQAGQGGSDIISMLTFLVDRAKMVLLDDEESAQMAAGFEHLLVELAADPLCQMFIDWLLKAVLPNPYPRYRDIALNPLGIAVLAVAKPDWSRKRMQDILHTGLDQEGVVFTFDLPCLLLAEAKSRSREEVNLARYCELALGSDDQWGTSVRAQSAYSAALFRQGNREEACNMLREAAELPAGYAGFATITLLSLANRWLEFGQPEDAGYQITRLVNEAAEQADKIRDYGFRIARKALVEEYRSWLADKSPNFESAAAKLRETPDRGTRRAYKDYISARWAWSPEAPNWEALKHLVPLTLVDGTRLDSVLARIAGLRIKTLSDHELDLAIQVCTQSLATGRPWERAPWG